MWILSSALEASAGPWAVTRLLSRFTGLLQYATCRCTYTTGVHGAGTSDRSDSFLTLRAGRAKFVGK